MSRRPRQATEPIVGRQSPRPLDAARRTPEVVVTMNSPRRHTARSLLMFATLAACLTAPATPSAPAPIEGESHPAASQELAAMRPEGRLRKLHLVRPDLIPYPIAYEVYC